MGYSSFKYSIRGGKGNFTFWELLSPFLVLIGLIGIGLVTWKVLT